MFLPGHAHEYLDRFSLALSRNAVMMQSSLPIDKGPNSASQNVGTPDDQYLSETRRFQESVERDPGSPIVPSFPVARSYSKTAKGSDRFKKACSVLAERNRTTNFKLFSKKDMVHVNGDLFSTHYKGAFTNASSPSGSKVENSEVEKKTLSLRRNTPPPPKTESFSNRLTATSK